MVKGKLFYKRQNSKETIDAGELKKKQWKLDETS
jgi:hypothetical protein